MMRRAFQAILVFGTLATVAPANEPQVSAERVKALLADLKKPEKRQAAAEALRKLGPAAKAAVPDLTSMLTENDGDSQDLALTLLAAIGPDAKEAIPAIRAAGASEKARAWTLDRVLVAQASITGKGDVALVRRIALMDSLPRSFHSKKIVVYGYVFGFPQMAVDDLLALASDKDVRVRSSILGTLQALCAARKTSHDSKDPTERLGAKYGAVVAAIIRMVDDPDLEIRLGALTSIPWREVDPQTAKRLLPKVSDLVQKQQLTGDLWGECARRVGADGLTSLVERLGDPAVRHQIGRAFAFFDKEAFAPLKSGLGDRDPARRAGAAVAMRELHNQRPICTAALAPVLKDPDAEVRACAAESLILMNPTAKEENPSEVVRAALEVVIAQLSDESPLLRRQAAGLLYSMQSQAALVPAIPALKKALTGGEKELAWSCAVALLRADRGEARLVAPILAKVARDHQSGHEVAALKLLASLGTAAREAAPALSELLHSKNEYLRVAALETVATIEPKRAADSVALLRKMLPAPVAKSKQIPQHVVDALGRIGPAAKPALPELEAWWTPLGKDHYQKVPLAAALIQIDANHSIGLQYLRGLLSNPKPKDDDEQYTVFESLRDSPGAVVPLLPELLPHLKDKQNYQRRMVVLAIGDAGPAARAALPALREMAASEKNASLVRIAKEAIQKIER